MQKLQFPVEPGWLGQPSGVVSHAGGPLVPARGHGCGDANAGMWAKCSLSRSGWHLLEHRSNEHWVRAPARRQSTLPTSGRATPCFASFN